MLKKRYYFIILFCMLLPGWVVGQYTVTGTVTDSDNTPLTGATVIRKGTVQGVYTDGQGKFSFYVNNNDPATLVVSYIGFATEEIAVSSSNNQISLSLEEDIARLDEVVVTGLASGVKRANSGNAVASINAEELSGNTQAQTLDYALYGKIPGVAMNANSGAPGGGINIQLRGISTLGAGSSQPLFIIDGVYVDNSTIRTGRTQVNGAGGGASGASQDDGANRIADINPDDIEKVEVLKGPSAAAIYGTRANAGVILITTKKGTAGKTKVSFSQDLGIGQGQNFVGLDGWNEDKIRAYFSGARVDQELQAYRAAVSENRVLDLEEELYGENAFLSNSQLSISGGNERTQFYISGGLQSEDGIIKNTGFDRYSARLNVDHRLSNRIKVSLNSTYTQSDSDRGFTGNQNNTGGSLGYTIAYTPSYAKLLPDATGNYPNNGYFDDNPFAIRDLGINNQKVDRFITAGNVEVDLLVRGATSLRLKVNGGLDYVSGNSLVYFPEILQHQRAQANPGDVMWGSQDNLNSNIQGFLQFASKAGEFEFNTTAGVSRLDLDASFLLSRGRGLSGGQTNLRWARVQSIESQINQEVTDIGLIAQQDINWDDKLIGSLGVRFDRSTLNVDQEKFYFFPKFSLAANLTNFDFWKIKSVNQLKLRAAYGETGGLPVFGRTFESLEPQLIGGVLGGQVSARGVDPNLEPETAQEIEFGLDAAAFNSRLSLEFTYYVKNVNDLILDLQPAEASGITAIATNAADLQNKGFEIGLGANPVRNNTLNWYSRVLYWQNRSEITELNIPILNVGGFGPSLGTYLIAEGFSPTTIIGNPVTQDNIARRTIYGDRQAKFDMSFFNQFTIFKNIDFNFLFHWKSGGRAINLSALLWDDGGTTPNWNGDDDGDGTPNGSDRIGAWAGGNTGVYIEDTDYLKLRELGLYYTIPGGLFNKAIQRAKIGVSANNLLLWTKYSSYDPEVSNFGADPIASSIEVSPYPSSRRFFFHLKLDF